jgi:fructosamine-3-kinase
MPDIQNLETMLSDHLPEITIKELEEMHGGLSGSRVYRLRMQANFPALSVKRNLPSFVIKISLHESLRKEAANYHRLPPEAKSYFAEVKTSRLYPLSKDREVSYLIMTDLEGFDTLHNAIHANLTDLKLLSRIFDRLYETLKNNIYRVRRRTSLGSNRLRIAKSLYLAKMEKTLQDVANRGLDIEMENIDVLQSYLDELFKQRIPEPPFLSMIHGDLHARNVLIRVQNNLSIDIKFIDIDNLAWNGDYMYDLGELAAHITHVGWIFEIDSPFLEIDNYSNFNPNEQKRLQAIGKIIDEKTFELADEFSESLDGAKARYSLSKARFLLTCSLHEQKENKAKIYFSEALRNLKECVSTV